MPRGSIYTTIMELGHQSHNGDGLLGPKSIKVVYMDSLGCMPMIRVLVLILPEVIIMLTVHEEHDDAAGGEDEENENEDHDGYGCGDEE